MHFSPFHLYVLLACTALIFGCSSHKKNIENEKSASSRASWFDDSIAYLKAIEELDTSILPQFDIRVNIHFVGNVDGNFYPGEMDDANYQNGSFWSERFLNHANVMVDSMISNPIFKDNFIGNARYRLTLWHDPNLVEDKHKGIWYWEDYFKKQLSYGDSVLHIIFEEKGKANDKQVTGYACGMDQCNSMVLFDAFDCARTPSPFGWWSYAGLFHHEFGHIMGLCHSFYCENTCKDIDLDIEAECVKNPCFSDCGGPNNKHCNAWDTGSNNMMGYHPVQSTLTPCQWKQLFTSLIFSKSKYIKERKPYKS